MVALSVALKGGMLDRSLAAMRVGVLVVLMAAMMVVQMVFQMAVLGLILQVGVLSPFYTQKYQNARVGDGDPSGEGSFRCLLTKATPRAPTRVTRAMSRGGRRLK